MSSGVYYDDIKRSAGLAVTALRGGSRAAFETSALITNMRRNLRSSLRLNVIAQALTKTSTRSASPHLDGMPVSVLRRILQALHLRSRIAVSQTCRRLREVSLSIPTLWARVTVGFGPIIYIPPNEVVQGPNMWRSVIHILSRSPPSSRDASFYFDASSFSEDRTVIDLFGSILDCVSVLRLIPHGKMPLSTYRMNTIMFPSEFEQLVTCRPSGRSWTTIRDALCAPAPHLRLLIIRARGFWDDTRTLFEDVSNTDQDSTLYLHHDTLAYQPGQLRACYLDGITLPKSSCHAFSALTLFDYRPTKDEISVAELACILDWMPSLETLGLTISLLTGDAIDSAPHPHLKRVAVKLWKSWELNLSQELSSSTVKYFKKRAPVASLILDWRTSIADVGSASSTLSLGLIHPHEIVGDRWLSRARTGDLSIIATPYVMVTEMVHNDACRCLTALTLDECLWPDAPFRSAPLLKYLCIVLMSCTLAYHGAMFGRCSGLFVYRNVDEPWECRALEEFRLAYHAPTCMRKLRSNGEDALCACRNGCILALSDVSEFIEQRLAFETPRLRRITLPSLHAQADLDPGSALLRLLELTEELSIDDEFPVELKELQGYGGGNLNSRPPSGLFTPFDRTTVEDWAGIYQLGVC